MPSGPAISRSANPLQLKWAVAGGTGTYSSIITIVVADRSAPERASARYVVTRLRPPGHPRSAGRRAAISAASSAPSSSASANTRTSATDVVHLYACAEGSAKALPRVGPPHAVQRCERRANHRRVHGDDGSRIRRDSLEPGHDLLVEVPLACVQHPAPEHEVGSRREQAEIAKRLPRHQGDLLGEPLDEPPRHGVSVSRRVDHSTGELAEPLDAHPTEVHGFADLGNARSEVRADEVPEHRRLAPAVLCPRRLEEHLASEHLASTPVS